MLADQGWDELTGAQIDALVPMLSGDHVLLVAPTGHGKTEAALLPVMSRLLEARDKGQWSKGFKAIYVTPLRALNRDLMVRLEHWAKALGIEIGVRHGDTPQSERSRQSRRPPDLLITTPETMQLLLYGDTLRSHLRTLQAVILDEIHDLAASERGAQLALALERIDEACTQEPVSAKERLTGKTPAGGSHFQRIGLSATVADPQTIATFLAGERKARIVVSRADKKTSLNVRYPEIDEESQRVGAMLAVPAGVEAQIRAVRTLVHNHARTLIFHNTRDGAELLASRSTMLDDEAELTPILGLHHGSLSLEHREQTEKDFRDGKLRGLVATSSLELGIDVGAIDHVIQVASPRSVARMVQRLGRAGHRVGAVSHGTLLASGPEDYLECLAVARRVEAGNLEPLLMREAPLVVLANQLIALVNEYNGVNPDWAYNVFRRAGPFLELERGLFDATWQALLDVQTLFESDTMPGHFGRSGRARRHFLSHISLIPDEHRYRVLDVSAGRVIGAVDDAFVAAGLGPGNLFIMAGRNWRVLEIEGEERRIRVAPVKEVGAVPQWTGSSLPVSLEVAKEVAVLRGQISRREPIKGALPEELDRAAQPIYTHMARGLLVPSESLVTIDVGRKSLTAMVALGTRGNEALGRITQALLMQRFDGPVGLETDAYRIHLTLPIQWDASELESVWRTLDPETLDLLLHLILKDSPLARHHLVLVAKQFGALPDKLERHRLSNAKIGSLLSLMALHEETLSRMVHERLDLDAVADFLRDVHAGKIGFHAQAMGPLSRIGQDSARLHTAIPSDEALLEVVRKRIEDAELLMVCCSCRHKWEAVIRDLPKRIKCRRCGSIQVACMRPWHKDDIKLLAQEPSDDEKKNIKRRIIKNGAMVASFGSTACRLMAARGIGPDTAARILQKVTDPEDPTFWRQLLEAELTFARTSAYWK